MLINGIKMFLLSLPFVFSFHFLLSVFLFSIPFSHFHLLHFPFPSASGISASYFCLYLPFPLHFFCFLYPFSIFLFSSFLFVLFLSLFPCYFLHLNPFPLVFLSLLSILLFLSDDGIFVFLFFISTKEAVQRQTKLKQR